MAKVNYAELFLQIEQELALAMYRQRFPALPVKNLEEVIVDQSNAEDFSQVIII